LTLQSKGERHLTYGVPGSQSETLGLTGKLSRAWEMALTFDTARPAQGPASRDLGLRMSFAGLPNTLLIHDTHLVLSMGDTSGLASAVPVPTAPARAGTGSIPPAHPLRVPRRRLDSVALEAKLLGQPITLGCASAMGTAGGLIYHFAADPKRRLQWEALRELRDLGRTSLVAHQRYAVRARLGRLTRLSFLREIHPEQTPGKLMLGHTLNKAEVQTRVGPLDLTGSIAWDRDALIGTGTEIPSLGVSGNLDSLTHVQVSYSGRSGHPDPAIPDHLVKLAFERKPDELLKVALSAEWRGWGDRRTDDLAWQLDLAAVF
jgi:hypothetical protein